MATITYKCPNCDGGLLFDPATQEYRCEYCRSHFNQEQLEAIMPDQAADQPAEESSGADTGSGAESRSGAESGSGAEAWIGAAGEIGAAAGTAGEIGAAAGAAGAWAAGASGQAAGAAGQPGGAAGQPGGASGQAGGAAGQPGGASGQPGGAAGQPGGASGRPAGTAGQAAGASEHPAAAPSSPAPQAMLYTCPSCGAAIVTDATTAATFCYYCHNPVVLAGRLEGGYEPNYVVPFQIDKKKAQEIFTQWMAKKKFVPKEFYSPKQIETMTGVYFPYWLFSCTINGEVEGQGTRLRTWTTGNQRYTETKIYDVKRAGSVMVDNVARNALKKANRRLVDGVQPFEMTQAEEFSMGYLSGFMAENRDMEKQAFEISVQQEVKDYAIGILRAHESNYNSVKVNRQQADIEHGRWEYALLPVWTLTYNDKAHRKIYYFALNGQTGKVCGELPVDRTKMLILFASVFLPLLVLFLIGGYLI